MSITYFKYLECSNCRATYSKDSIHGVCTNCESPLFARYDIEQAKSFLRKEKFWRRYPNMWRYWEMLPVEEKESIVTLQEGFTPIFKMNNLGRKLGLKGLFVKDEALNPTGSFKSRGLSTAVSKAKEFGVKKVAIPSAGNAGSALAAYAAKCGMPAFIFMPKDTPQAFITECKFYGANVELVGNSITESARAMRSRKEDWFDMSTLKEPYRIEGKKIMGYELVEQFRWKAPDVIIYPTGGGTGLIGMWKAFDELEQLGWIDSKRPKMVVVQSSGCAPIVKAFEEGKTKAEEWKNPSTIASGLKVPLTIGDFLILDIIKKSRGTAISVSDKEILESMKEFTASEGIFVSPEGAATLAGLKKLKEQKFVSVSERILLFNTASGLKYIDVFKI